eukprot:TRINITY_DN4778_c0_g1_i1.p1 TRINITY_DN4778_c0_g1~~TRINITY_DN4778_c0_g1_i1.p1  ORF type:complete len:604 (-),score=152.14 TRINITY_DN4778_c0_g1_i1:1349-2965(-)
MYDFEGFNKRWSVILKLFQESKELLMYINDLDLLKKEFIKYYLIFLKKTRKQLLLKNFFDNYFLVCKGDDDEWLLWPSLVYVNDYTEVKFFSKYNNNHSFVEMKTSLINLLLKRFSKAYLPSLLKFQHIEQEIEKQKFESMELNTHIKSLSNEVVELQNIIAKVKNNVDDIGKIKDILGMMENQIHVTELFCFQNNDSSNLVFAGSNHDQLYSKRVFACNNLLKVYTISSTGVDWNCTWQQRLGITPLQIIQENNIIYVLTSKTLYIFDFLKQKMLERVNLSFPIISASTVRLPESSTDNVEGRVMLINQSRIIVACVIRSNYSSNTSSVILFFNITNPTELVDFMFFPKKTLRHVEINHNCSLMVVTFQNIVLSISLGFNATNTRHLKVINEQLIVLQNSQHQIIDSYNVNHVFGKFNVDEICTIHLTNQGSFVCQRLQKPGIFTKVILLNYENGEEVSCINHKYLTYANHTDKLAFVIDNDVYITDLLIKNGINLLNSKVLKVSLDKPIFGLNFLDDDSSVTVLFKDSVVDVKVTF